jgi:hypothetical protein
VKDHLNPAGIATYWLPAYLVLEDEALASSAFCEAFEDCSLWSDFHRDWILVGSRGGIAPVTREQFSRLWRLERTGSELRRLGVDSPAELAALFMADADALRELTARTAPLSTTIRGGFAQSTIRSRRGTRCGSWTPVESPAPRDEPLGRDPAFLGARGER